LEGELLAVWLPASVLEAMGGRVESVAVSSLREEVFYATVRVIAADGTAREIDARPSDAINLAARVNAPILVADEVMASAGVILPELAGRLDEEAGPAPADAAVEWRSMASLEVLRE
jgi:bifunctional DNase/RNase